MSGHRAFPDRRAAGRELAGVVLTLGLESPVVLALPRGGVPVGFEVARALGVPLDLLMVRKLGAPGNAEYGIGAVVDGASSQVEIDEAAARIVGAGKAWLDAAVSRELAEIERRRRLYRTGPPVPLAGRETVVVDDGIATGNTMRAALKALRRAGPARIVLAVPLAPADILAGLRPLCDAVVCLTTPDPFYAVGAHYRNFDQTEDAEVVRLLAEARQGNGP